ncbi:MAG: putative glycoside hydrolase [Patescibacteria group bacterium]
MKPLFLFGLLTVLGTAFFLISLPNEVEVLPQTQLSAVSGQLPDALPQIPEQKAPTTTLVASTATPSPLLNDLPNQPQLANPPEVIKGIYVTGWTAGSASRMNRLIDLIKRTELNAVVVDIKDYSGYVSYRTGIAEVAATGAEGELRILQPNALIKKLHDAGIYIIARQTVFQDPILAKAHPEWALHDSTKLMTMTNDNDSNNRQWSSSSLWFDRKGLPWMDAAAKPVWDYNIAIAKNAIARGFDEVNFDYIRFASDGNLNVIKYPFWQKTRTDADLTRTHAETKQEVIKSFFKYLRESLPGAKISADLFGLATLDTWDDLGIGQVIEDAYEYFDYIAPMVYPSHYAKGFSGYQKPAEYPYEVVKYSMDKALGRLIATNKVVTGSMIVGTTTVEQFEYVPKFAAKLRPWLQDFDLGATYDAQKVRAQIQATDDALLGTPAHYNGWMLWDPANNYTEGALESAR